MSFARKVWHLLVGIKDALALAFLLGFFVLLFAALSARPNPGLVREGALLLKLDGMVVEEKSRIDALGALLSGTLPTGEYPARELAHAIDEAATDDRIKAIALDLSTFLGGGQVHLREVGDALARFRRADKPIYAWGVAYSDDAMMLAAHADEIWVDPMGGVAIRGPGGYNLYYAEALERFDVTANVYKVGTYKSAVEPYTQSGMSDLARQNAQGYLGALWEEWQAHVRQARSSVDIEAASSGLVETLAASDGDFAQAAIASGFVDRIGTRDEWGARVAELVGKDSWDDHPGAFTASEFAPYLADVAPDDLLDNDGAVGVITIAGEITDGATGPGSAGAARIERLLDEALNDDLAALVVRVDSPGGSVSGSEVIRRAIMRHKDKGIPIAVSMGNYAASGGYWVATPATRIFAEPETLTGSIGVFLVVPSFEDLLAEYGVTSDGVQTTALSGQPDLLAGLTPQTEALLQGETEAIYARFTRLVAEARNLPPARADELGQGRVWTGGEARQLGLVDQFGDLHAAIAWAAEQANLGEDYDVAYLADAPDPFTAMVEGMLAGDEAATSTTLAGMSSLFARTESDFAARAIADLERLLTTSGVQARCLECESVHSPRPHAHASAERGWLATAVARLLGH